MVDARNVYATFSVTSGALCFGALHNIWSGAASVPVQGLPDVRPNPHGTVISHTLDHNVPAENGTWIVFHLVDVETTKVCGWFISHVDVDPGHEIDKLIRVSGSPYENDSGSSMNNNDTKANGVFVINRYDWGYYDQRCREEIGEGIPEGEGVEDGPYDMLANSNSVGLVDYAQARDQAREWENRRPSERGPSEGGVWLYIPYGEYLFGRFGFNDAHMAARSFLFFSASTTFTSATFSGLNQTLRKKETHEERFERMLHDGTDFSGISALHRMSSPPEFFPHIVVAQPPPPESECLGPYDQAEHIFRGQDLDALRLLMREIKPAMVKYLQSRNYDVDTYQRGQKFCEFVDPWKDPVYDLLNELALSHIERFAITHAHTPFPAAEDLFPHYADIKNLDYHLYPYFTQPHAKPVPGFDADLVGRRIKLFLSLRTGDTPITLSDNNIAGLCRVVAFLISEILEVANMSAVDNYRTGIVPCDIRIALYNDDQLYNLLQYSVVLWKGRGASIETEKTA